MNKITISEINKTDLTGSQTDPSADINKALETMIQAMEDYASGKISYSQLGSIMEANGAIIDQYPQFYTTFDQPPGRLTEIDQIVAQLNTSPPPSADEIGSMAGILQHFSSYPPLAAANPFETMKNDISEMEQLIDDYQSGSISIDGLIVKMNALWSDVVPRLGKDVGSLPAVARIDMDIYGSSDPSPLRSIMADPAKLQAFIADLSTVYNAIPNS